MPTYKLSQDHLELLFSNIRAHGGCNNNPKARHFMAIYKKLLVKLELNNFESGNCMALENISILTCSSSVEKMNKSTLSPMIEEEMENEEYIKEFDEVLKTENIMTEFSSEIVSYIAGNVVHFLLNKIKCETCISALLNSSAIKDNFKLIRLKDNGGLIFPSADVILICKKIESILKTFTVDAQLVKKFEKFKKQITSRALRHFIGIEVFREIDFHQFDQGPMENHVILLTKCIIERYTDIRLHHLMKTSAQKVSKRQLLNKYLHFTGQ
ncbi:unnamed protein product [Parnassius mnemosyne]|uniref:Transposable element P transposase n=1 Tax=Parnassius mnemosyne TaxID=213953 RepID=A0AAV1KKR7_9NEOP